MTDAATQAITFDAKGKTFQVDLGINAVCDLEDQLDKSVSEIGEEMTGSPSLRFLRTVFHTSLKTHQPAVTVQEAGDLMSEVGAQRVGELIGQALAKTFPEG